MQRLSAISLQLIAQLSDRASLCSAIFSAWSRLSPGAPVGIRELTAAASLSVSEEHGTDEILRVLANMGLLVAAGTRWIPAPGFHAQATELCTAFGAIDHYLEHVHRDATEAQVVLTRPTQSIALGRELAEAGWRTAGTEETERAFMTLVQRATWRVVVMTPFLDERGASWLRELLAAVAPGIDIILVLRSLEDPGRSDYPKGFPLLRNWLRERGASVYNYSLPSAAGSTRETFHAKVILADAEFAYVGSANVTAASREHSMEMGVVVKGRAAAEIAVVVDAAIKSAESWPL